MVRVIDKHYKSGLFPPDLPRPSIALALRNELKYGLKLLKASLKQKAWQRDRSKGRGSNESGGDVEGERIVRRRGYLGFQSRGNR